MAVPAMPREAAPPEAVAAVESLLPSSKPRRVAIIAATAWSLEANLQAAARAIPFFGMLMGFAAIGHAVCIFDGSTPETLAAGCEHADLVVDGALEDTLQPGWQALAAPLPGTPPIRVYDQTTRQLRKL